MATADFFVSYTAVDRNWAEWIAWQLYQAGHEVRIQAWHSRAGGNFVGDIHEALGAQRVLAVLSPRYLESKWCMEEWTNTLARNPGGVLVPVRVADFQPSGLLAAHTYIDLVGLDRDTARHRLINELGEKGPPTNEPPFPAAPPTGATFPPDLPRAVHNLPFPPNSVFRGRDDELRKVRAALDQRNAVAVTQAAAITGLGGVGKTQLAIEYAWDAIERREYDYVLWVRAESTAALDASLAALAGCETLNLPGADILEQAVLLDVVLRWLKTTDRRWLLLADNADSMEAVNAVRERLPVGSHGHVLITSRLDRWEGMRKVSLDTLGLAEAAQLLAEVSVREAPGHEPGSDADARALAKELGCLPLALEQAAAYLGELRWSFAHYMEVFRQQRPLLLAAHRIDIRRYPAPVATTWLISLKQLTPFARAIMRFAAWFAPGEIPRRLFIASLEEFRKPPAAIDDVSQIGVEQALADLAHFSLLKLTVETASVHRLLQTVERDLLDSTERKAWLIGAIGLVLEYAPFASDDVREWGVWTPLRPHVETLLKQAREQQVQTSAVAWLSDRFATFLQARAEYDRAEPLFRDALQVDMVELGSDHPTVALHLHNLAELLRETGRFAEAEPLFRDALQIDEFQVGPDDPIVAVRLNSLAKLLHQTARSAEAEPLFRRALQIDEKQFGPTHLSVANRLDNLGSLLRDTERAAEAEPFLRRALEIEETLLGPHNEGVALSLNNLARLLRDTARVGEAEPLFHRALEIDEARFGSNHPRVASDLNNLAILLHDTRRNAEAEPLSARAVAIFENALPANHPNISWAGKTMLNICHALGKS